MSKFCSSASVAALGAFLLLAGGCASSGSSVLLDADKRHEWVGRKFADVIDATDKAFGESRIEDREEIVRAKVGLKAKVREGDDTKWSIPANFRIPLPAMERRFNIFIEAIADPDTSNLSDVSAAAGQNDASLSATIINRLSENFDLGASLGVHGGPDIGPEVFVRYDKKWLPWAVFGEQRGYWRTDNGWGGRTIANLDYRLADETSYVRFANKADYYEELHKADLKSGLIYRRLLPGTMAVSAETGVEYNPYNGDPQVDEPTTNNDDDDQYYVRLRMIGRVWKPWIEWEIMPGYYYMWEHDDTGVWGINARLSVMYESFLRPE